MLPNLKRLRQERGISQQKLADAIHVSQPSVNKYENHNIEPDIGILMRMADYFGTSVDYIIGHTDIRRRIEPVEECCLNCQEQEVITQFRALSETEKQCVCTVIRTLRRIEGEGIGGCGGEDKSERNHRRKEK